MQGIVVFASVMATLGLQILFESGRELIIKVCNFQLICVSCMVLNHHLSTMPKN